MLQSLSSLITAALRRERQQKVMSEEKRAECLTGFKKVCHNLASLLMTSQRTEKQSESGAIQIVL
jgi:hypothetical protein